VSFYYIYVLITQSLISKIVSAPKKECFIEHFRLKIPLTKGKWVVYEKDTWRWANVDVNAVDIARLGEDNEILEAISLVYSNWGGNYQSAVNQVINKAIFYDEHDGCYEKPEYYVINFYHKGSTHNCLIIGHSDPMKELYNPDDSSMRIYSSETRKWIEDNNIKLPKIGFYSSSTYFSRLTGSYWYVLNYFIDPKILEAPEINNFSEETSEYHKLNIHKYPQHKKIMDLWVSISTKRHQEFEKLIKVKQKHLLDLQKYNPQDHDLFKPQSKKIKNSEKSNIVEELDKLNELFKAGVLTKEEFEKAKKKILN